MKFNIETKIIAVLSAIIFTNPKICGATDPWGNIATMSADVTAGMTDIIPLFQTPVLLIMGALIVCLFLGTIIRAISNH